MLSLSNFSIASIDTVLLQPGNAIDRVNHRGGICRIKRNEPYAESYRRPSAAPLFGVGWVGLLCDKHQ